MWLLILVVNYCSNEFFWIYSRVIAFGKITQLTFTSSKKTLETLEKGVKYVES